MTGMHTVTIKRNDGTRGYQSRPFARTNGRPTVWYAKCTCGWIGRDRSYRRDAKVDGDDHGAAK